MISYILTTMHASVLNLRFEPASVRMEQSNSIEGLPCIYIPDGRVEAAKTGFFASEPIGERRHRGENVLISMDDAVITAPLRDCLIPVVTQSPLGASGEPPTNDT